MSTDDKMADQNNVNKEDALAKADALIGAATKRRDVPLGVRLAADITLLMLAISLAQILGTLSLVKIWLPVIVEILMTLLLAVFVLGYRATKKWAFFGVATLFILSLVVWIFSISKGAPLELGRLIFSNAMPLILLVLGVTNWSKFK
jgi:hypothetical protein